MVSVLRTSFFHRNLPVLVSVWARFIKKLCCRLFNILKQIQSFVYSFGSQVVLRSADFPAKHLIWDQHWHHFSEKVITEYFGTDKQSMEEISFEKLSIEMGKTGVKNEVLIHPDP